MPSILRRFSKPLVTPSTMLAIRLRVRPCRARFWRSSSGRVTLTVLPASSYSMRMFAWTGTSSLPLGPSTKTLPSATRTLTPAGTAIGCLPMRDIAGPPRSIHGAEQLAADALGAGTAVAHDAIAGAQDGDAEAVEHRPQLGALAVQPAAGPAGPVDGADDALPFGAVLQEDAQHRLGGQRRPFRQRLERRLEALLVGGHLPD